jgi:hypothetical protein
VLKSQKDYDIIERRRTKVKIGLTKQRKKWSNRKPHYLSEHATREAAKADR